MQQTNNYLIEIFSRTKCLRMKFWVERNNIHRFVGQLHPVEHLHHNYTVVFIGKPSFCLKAIQRWRFCCFFFLVCTIFVEAVSMPRRDHFSYIESWMKFWMHEFYWIYAILDKINSNGLINWLNTLNNRIFNLDYMQTCSSYMMYSRKLNV